MAKAKTDALEAAREVLRTKTAKKFDGVLLDLQTAGAIAAVHDALKDPTNRRKLREMDIGRAGLIAWKLVS